MRKKKTMYPVTNDMVKIDREALRKYANRVHASMSYISAEMYDGRSNVILQRVSRGYAFTREDCEKLAGYLHCDAADFIMKTEESDDETTLPAGDSCVILTREEFRQAFDEVRNALELKLFGKEDK